MQTTSKSSEKPSISHENKFDDRIIHKFTVQYTVIKCRKV